MATDNDMAKFAYYGITTPEDEAEAERLIDSDSRCQMEFHPVANIFPLLQGEEYEKLKIDIIQNGLRVPIWMHPDGRIIDGRNRWRVCAETGINADFEVWDEAKHGPLIRFVISLNLHRRHLDSSQRAAIAVEVLPMLEEEAKERQGQRNDLNGTNGTSVKKFTEVEKPEPQRATKHAAELFHTNQQYVSDAKKIKEDAPELYEQVRNGQLKIPEAKRQMSQPLEVLLSHKDTEWYTPPEYIEAARQVMGGIDLDPATAPVPQEWIKAAVFYTAADNGLVQPWQGRVWLNPPYSTTEGQSNQELWSLKLIEEYKAGRVTEAILLVKASLGYHWFDRLFDIYPVCFKRGLISFINTRGESGPAKLGSAFFYLGPNLARFSEVFSQFGRVIIPEESMYAY